MGKSYNASLEEMAIVDGKLVNVTINDNFTSKHDTSGSVRTIEGATFALDGLPVDVMIKFLWDALKVKAQARTWKGMSDSNFLALDGENHNINTFIPKSTGTGSKGTIISNVLKELQEDYYNTALEMAVEELGADAEQEDYAAQASKIYDNLYAPVIDRMIKKAQDKLEASKTK